MAIKQTKPMFKTEDGREFETQKEAERHDRLYNARVKYESARREFSQALFETQKTADGEFFKFCIYDYYFIFPSYGNGWPSIRTVSFIGWNYDIDDNDELVIRTQRDDGQWVKYEISELYSHKKNAEAALIVAQKERLAEFAEQLERKRIELGLE